MRKPHRNIALAVLTLALSLTTSHAGHSRPLPNATVEPTADSYAPVTDIRLKKMHLVRPDLIPYPTLQDYYA